MGAGASGVASVRLKREFIGIELDENFIRVAIKRMKEAATFNSELI